MPGPFEELRNLLGRGIRNAFDAAQPFIPRLSNGIQAYRDGQMPGGRLTLVASQDVSANNFLDALTAARNAGGAVRVNQSIIDILDPQLGLTLTVRPVPGPRREFEVAAGPTLARLSRLDLSVETSRNARGQTTITRDGRATHASTLSLGQRAAALEVFRFIGNDQAIPGLDAMVAGNAPGAARTAFTDFIRGLEPPRPAQAAPGVAAPLPLQAPIAAAPGGAPGAPAAAQPSSQLNAARLMALRLVAEGVDPEAILAAIRDGGTSRSENANNILSNLSIVRQVSSRGPNELSRALALGTNLDRTMAQHPIGSIIDASSNDITRFMTAEQLTRREQARTTMLALQQEFSAQQASIPMRNMALLHQQQQTALSDHLRMQGMAAQQGLQTLQQQQTLAAQQQMFNQQVNLMAGFNNSFYPRPFAQIANHSLAFQANLANAQINLYSWQLLQMNELQFQQQQMQAFSQSMMNRQRMDATAILAEQQRLQREQEQNRTRMIERLRPLMETPQERHMIEVLRRLQERQQQTSSLGRENDGTALALGDSLRESGVTNETTAPTATVSNTLLQRVSSLLGAPQNVTTDPQGPVHTSATPRSPDERTV